MSKLLAMIELILNQGTFLKNALKIIYFKLHMIVDFYRLTSVKPDMYYSNEFAYLLISEFLNMFSY